MRRRTAIALGGVAVAAIAVGALVGAQQPGDGYFDDQGFFHRKARADIGGGMEVIEDVRGPAADGPVELDYPGGPVRIPQAEGIHYGHGPGAYLINLPHGTSLMIYLASPKADVFDLDRRDQGLLSAIVASVPWVEVRILNVR